MKKSLLLLLVFLSLNAVAAATANYPSGPDPRLTPGAICTLTEKYRYPERIAYCERDVSVELKSSIFQSYRKILGYTLSGARNTYKIDHFIPLCAGGSNERENLWPQHVSVYSITDPLEELACKRLAKGLITQQEVINLIVTAKRDLRRAGEVYQYLQNIQ